MILRLVDRRARPGAPPLAPERLAAVVARCGHPDWELNLVLVEDREMASLNERWYGGEGTTDVLSFSYLEERGEGPPHLPAGVGEAAGDLWLAPGEAPTAVTVGEVVLAPAYVARRAQAGGWELAAEWALLLAHGALHVLGWRHDDRELQQAMQGREAALLADAGFAHPLLEAPKEER